MGRQVFGFTEFLGIVVHDYGVADEDTHQRDDAEVARQRKLTAWNEHAHRRPEEHQGERYEQEDRRTYLAEVGEHQEEDDDNTDEQAIQNLWIGLVGLLILAASLGGDALRETVGIDLFLQFGCHSHNVHTFHYVGHDSDGASAIAMAYLPVLPAG